MLQNVLGRDTINQYNLYLPDTVLRHFYMSRFVFVSVFLMACWSAYAQDPDRVMPIEEQLMRKAAEKNATQSQVLLRNQRYLAFDTGSSRYRFFVGDEIRFKLRGDRFKYAGEIVSMSDSSFTFSVVNEVTNRFENVSFNMADVKRIYITRRIPFVSALQYFAPLAGVGYMMADIINGKRWKDSWVNPQVAKVTGGFILVGFASRVLCHPSYKINQKHRLKVLKTL